jgi:hypothetical protein
MDLRILELNGGLVSNEETLRLSLPQITEGYADAQIDDYGPAPDRAHYPWQPGVVLSLRARFSHDRDNLVGTAGFGFWNAPFGDPTVRFPALPQASWYFFASQPSDLPFAPDGPGRGWFAATIDAGSSGAMLTAPLAPAILLLNQFQGARRRIWPWVRRRLNISYAQLLQPMTDWHDYELLWNSDGCIFSVDGEIVIQSPYSPRGPLGFVCWIDNQYMVATARGRLRWGVLPTNKKQTLEIVDLTIATI